MYRYKLEELKAWKRKVDRKPLIIRGARQVGKTWLAQEFGRTEYAQTAYINFDNNPRMQSLFSQDLDTSRIVQGLKAEANVDIAPHNTLIILDEIQEVPQAITALKYFYENSPEYHVVVAGSLLGVALHDGVSFPVGKVDFLDLHPLTLKEFLLALNEMKLIELLESEDYSLMATFRDKYIDLLKTYYFVGGLPEAVKTYSETKSWNDVRTIQNNILAAYEQDFSKHAPLNTVPRLRQIWRNIPRQLAKENKKFTYGLIREGARAKDYELALTWLEDTGLIYRIGRVSTPKLPLKAYQDFSAFKIYLLDVGLLTTMTGLTAQTLLRGDAVFTEFKGSLTEQYVLQELKNIGGTDVFYWASDEGSTAEIDFLVQLGETILPVEVKAEENLQSKSLRVYAQKYSPKVVVRTSMADYRDEGWLANIPLYTIGGQLLHLKTRE